MDNKKILLILLPLLIIGFLVGSVIVWMNLPDSEEEPTPEPTDNVDINKVDPQKVLFELSPGINLAGAEFGKDTADYEHTYPNESISYYTERGFKLFRLPFAWERLQPTLGGELDEIEANSIESFMNDAFANGAVVILDLHNYNRYEGQIVGQSSVKDEDLADVWSKIAQRFGENPGLIAYGIMNEPYDSGETWPVTAQKSVDAIRSIDKDTIILVAGDNWSQSWTWQKYNSRLNINDPENLLVYETHVYFDPDRSGKYECDFDQCNVSLNIGQVGLQDFVEWLKLNDKKGFVGEYGVPSDDPRWARVLDKTLSYMEREGLGSTIWAGGPDWGDYNLSLEPIIDVQGDLVERPQIEVLMEYLDTEESK